MAKKKSKDILKNRRLLAFIAALHGFFLWPYMVVFLSKHFNLSDEFAHSLLSYMEIISSGPMVAYFIGAHVDQKNYNQYPQIDDDFSSGSGTMDTPTLDTGDGNAQ